MGNFSEALSYAASLCSASEQCAQDILKKTEKFELSETDKAQLIERLEKEGFLDRRRFVHAFVSDKFRFSKWGKVKLHFMLRQKGLDEAIIKEELDGINENAYLETLYTLLVQKKSGIKSQNAYELNAKLHRFALSRGFEPAVISVCLKQLTTGTHEQDAYND
ncbi:MAG: regulatory protein RecX [Bacteroidota bacterium]|nr:regulatory protein RecX [Bacteroidota bacterium]